MDAALISLKVAGEQEFLRSTRTALRVIQNAVGGEEKYLKVRSSSKYACKPGVAGLLEALGFKLEGDLYILRDIDTLPARKAELIAARRATGSLLGWDIPSSCLRFSALRGKGRFGDVFSAVMDGEKVSVKTLRPDCSPAGKEAFDRELDVLRKVSHANILNLLAVTLTSDPTSLVMEFASQGLLDLLHHGDLCEKEMVGYAKQVASAMLYLHSLNVLHCDLAARNVFVNGEGAVKLGEFGLARMDGTPSCRLQQSDALKALNVRWSAVEVLSHSFLSKHSDVWSYGVLLYELVTSGSVPYATLSHSDVQAKVPDGYRLPQPLGCHDDVYSLMLHCWSRRPTERPHFSDIIKSHLTPLESKLASGEARVAKATGSDESNNEGKKTMSRKPSVKVKELSYQSVSSKGGGLLRVYTALVSPFDHRVTVVCGRKTSVAEVVTTALAKCGKADLDPKCHRLALVSGQSSGSPAHYLDTEDKVLSVKSGATPTSMFVLCVNMPGHALLEVIDSVRQNPAYGSAFSAATRGHLVCRGGGAWQRCWCVLDGSTLLCYSQEEDEGVKQFASFLDFKGCSVTSTGHKKGHVFKIETAERAHFAFSATDKSDMLRWVEAIEAAGSLPRSPLLLHASGGAVVQAGYMECQEFANESTTTQGGGGVSPLDPMVPRKLGLPADFNGTFAAVDYGKHWIVLHSSGLLQCLVDGRPETLLDLSKASKVKVNNPREMKEGVDYCIEVEVQSSRFILRAELPTDHSDWVLAIERILDEQDKKKLLLGHRKRESGYVALKRLLLSQSQVGGGGSSQTYCLPRVFDDMEDIYEPLQPKVPQLPAKPGQVAGSKRSELLSPEADNVIPLPPKDYLPPPLPPRSTDETPPIPPRMTSSGGRTLPLNTPQQQPSRPTSLASNSSSNPDDEYVLMQPSPSPSGGVPASSRSFANTAGIGRAGTLPSSSSPSSASSRTQPITIPHRQGPKRSVLLRADSEASSYANSPSALESSLSDLHEGLEWVNTPSHSRHQSVTSSTFSLPRHPSSQSLASTSSSSFTQHHHHHRVGSNTSSNGGHPHQLSCASLTTSSSDIAHPPPLPPPRNSSVTERASSSGYNSPLLGLSPSPGGNSSSSRLRRSQSSRLQRYNSTSSDSHPVTMPNLEESRSDGIMMSEAKKHFSSSSASHHHHPISRAGSVTVPQGRESDGYCSSHSSNEDLTQLLPPGWERGYSQHNGRYFYFNSLTGASTWNIQEVLVLCQSSSGEKRPGVGWEAVRMDDGRVYYYHQRTRRTTWSLEETMATV